jgi:hypothetical protein
MAFQPLSLDFLNGCNSRSEFLQRPIKSPHHSDEIDPSLVSENSKF